MSSTPRSILYIALLLPVAACESGSQQRASSAACEQAAARLSECGHAVPSSFQASCQGAATPDASAAIAVSACDDLTAALSDSFDLKADQTTFTCADLQSLTKTACAVLQATPGSTMALPPSLASIADPKKLKAVCTDVQRENFCSSSGSIPTGTGSTPSPTPAQPGPPCTDDPLNPNDDALACALYKRPGQTLVCRPTFSSGFDEPLLDPRTGQRKIAKFCLPPAVSRQRCEAAEDCGGGLSCSDKNDEHVAMCALPSEGTPCSDNAYCRSVSPSATLVCRPSRRYTGNVCLAPAPPGELCNVGDNSDCANGQCLASGQCYSASMTSGGGTTPSTGGGSSTPPAPRPSGSQQVCNETSTVSDRPSAAVHPCMGGNVCRPSGDPRFVGNTVCLNPGGNGDRCLDDYDCAATPTWLVCRSGFCRP